MRIRACTDHISIKITRLEFQQAPRMAIHGKPPARSAVLINCSVFGARRAPFISR